MHWIWLGIMFGHSKNACIMHIAYCMGLEGVICIMRCDYIRPSTVRQEKSELSKPVVNVIWWNFIIFWRFSLHACWTSSKALGQACTICLQAWSKGKTCKRWTWNLSQKCNNKAMWQPHSPGLAYCLCLHQCPPYLEPEASGWSLLLPEKGSPKIHSVNTFMQNKTMTRPWGMGEFQPFCSVIETPSHRNKAWCGMSFGHLVVVYGGEMRNCEWQDACRKAETFWEGI